MDGFRLYTPGPTPVPERVSRRMAEPLPHHRTQEFRTIMSRVNASLREVFQTTQPVLPLTSSGTGAMEALVVNLFSPGETVLTVNGGKFGGRWTDLARTFGLHPVEIPVPWGDVVEPLQLQETLHLHPEAKGVLLTHSETSTGATADLRALASVVRQRNDLLLCVDGITSIGAHEVRFDAWGLDACVTASQKGLMVPPGLAFVALSPRAIAAMQTSTMPRFYFDLRKSIRTAASNDTPWTPAISLLLGLDEALAMIREEGIENVWRRHAVHTRAIRAGVVGLGLRLFSRYPSHAVTTVWLPDGLAWQDLRNTMREQSGMIIAGGQGEYTGKIFRIGHIGYFRNADIRDVVVALARALDTLGVATNANEGTSAVERELGANPC